MVWWTLCTGTVDYSAREPEMGLAKAEEVTAATVPAETLTALKARIEVRRRTGCMM